MTNSLESELDVEMQLNELTDNLKTETRSVAARMLTWMGHHEPLVHILDDRQCQPFWQDAIEGFRQDLLLNPRLAEDVNRLRNDDNPEHQKLHRLLVGLSDNDLASGEGSMFVSELSSDQLYCRVLAFETLRSITGKSLGYRPEHDERARRTPTKKWESSLKRSGLSYEKPVVVPRLQIQPNASKTDSDDQAQNNEVDSEDSEATDLLTDPDADDE